MNKKKFIFFNPKQKIHRIHTFQMNGKTLSLFKKSKQQCSMSLNHSLNHNSNGSQIQQSHTTKKTHPSLSLQLLIFNLVLKIGPQLSNLFQSKRQRKSHLLSCKRCCFMIRGVVLSLRRSLDLIGLLLFFFFLFFFLFFFFFLFLFFLV